MTLVTQATTIPLSGVILCTLAISIMYVISRTAFQANKFENFELIMVTRTVTLLLRVKLKL